MHQAIGPSRRHSTTPGAGPRTTRPLARAGTLLLILGHLATPASSRQVGPSDLELKQHLETLVSDSSPDTCGPAADQGLLDQFICAYRETPSIEDSARRVGERLALPDEAHRPLLTTVLTVARERALLEEADDAREEVGVADPCRDHREWSATVPGRFDELTRRFGPHPAIATELATFLDREIAGAYCPPGPAFVATLSRLLREAPAEWELLEVLKARTGFGSAQPVLARWLESEPRNPLLLAALGEKVYAETTRAALFGQALELATRSQPPLPPVARASLLQKRLIALLALGLETRALQDLDAQDDGVRRLLLQGDRSTLEVEVGGVISRWTLTDLRRELAGALLLADRQDEARTIVAQLDLGPEPEIPDNPFGYLETDREKAYRQEVTDHLLRWSVRDERSREAQADPFDLLSQALGAHQATSWFTGGSWYRLASRLARDAGYRSMERFALTRACLATRTPTTPGIPEAALRDTALERRLSPAIDALGEENQKRRRELAQRIEELSGAAGVAALPHCMPHPLATTAEILTAIPDARLETLADGKPADEQAAWLDRDESFAAARALGIEDFQLSNVVIGETDVVALGFPGGYPGPAGVSAYWLTRSRDAGTTWSPPIYTGMPASRVTIRPSAEHHRLQGDRLTLEVSMTEHIPLSAWSIDFDGSGPRSGRLSLDLTVLEDDTDGDGLTDFLERRLGLSPDRPDSDGDGLDDPIDPTPAASETLVSARIDPGLVQRFLQLALQFHTQRPWSPTGTASTTPLYEGNALILSAPGLSFEGVQAPLPLLLGADAFWHPAEDARNHVELFELSQSGDQAMIAWSIGRAGRVLLRRLDGAWRVEAGFSSGGCTRFSFPSEMPRVDDPVADR